MRRCQCLLRSLSGEEAGAAAAAGTEGTRAGGRVSELASEGGPHFWRRAGGRSLSPAAPVGGEGRRRASGVGGRGSG